MRNTLNELFFTAGRKAMSLFFPEKCYFCGAYSESIPNDHGICPSCKERLLYLNNNDLSQILEGLECGPDSIFCAVRYVDIIKKAIVGLKYSGKAYMAKPLAWIMYNALSSCVDFKKYDFICVVPSSKAKIRERGYNQVDLIARDVSKYCGVPYIPDVLIKVRDLPSQSLLNLEERFKNVSGIFQINKKNIVLGNKLILIDDVLTTGATIIECGRILKYGGATKVTALALATGKRNV